MKIGLAAACLAAGLTVAGPGLAQTERAERHRAPAEYMSFRGADWLERADRVVEEQPERVLDAMRLEPGDVVADIGCGSGYYARRIVRRVSPGGTVYCEDIQPEMLEIMQARARDDGISGIVPVLGTPTDARLPSGTVDWIFIADVYHEMSDPDAMLRTMKTALAPGGRVALLEYRAEDGSGDRIKADHTMSVRQVLAEWQTAGFELVALHEFLPTQHLFVFRVRDPRVGSDPIVHLDLIEAIDRGVAEVEARGGGDNAVTVRLKRRSAEDVVVTAAAGLYFAAPEGAADLLARRDSWVILADDRWQEVSVRVVRRQPGMRAPRAGDPLTIRPRATAPHVARVLEAIQAGTYRVGDSPTLYPPRTLEMERAAVWLADDDIDYAALAGLLGDDPFPKQYAVAFALVFCDLAGIDITQRRIWTDREEIFGRLRDPGLDAWYQVKASTW